MEKSEKGKKVISPWKLVSRIARSLTRVLGTESKTPKNELSQPSNPTSVTSNTATNTNAGASSSRTSQERQMGASASNVGTSGGSGAGDIGVDDHRLAPSYALIHTTHLEIGYIRSMVAGVGFNGILFTGSDNRLVREWREGYALAHFNSSSGPINAISLQYPGPDARIFCGHDDGAIRVWERDIIKREGMFRFRPIRTLQKPIDLFKNSILLRRKPRDKAVSCLCLSESGEFIYSGSVDCTVKVWRIQGWKLVDTLRGHIGAINALAIGNGVVFSGSRDGTVTMWRRDLYGAKRDKVRHVLIRTTFIISMDVVNAVVFGRVGCSTDLVYAGSSDGKVRCWRNWLVDTPEVMSFHQGAVSCLALCSGRFVFSGSEDSTICVWKRGYRAEFHTPAMVLTGHSGPVRCIQTQEDWEEEDDTGASRWILYSASLDRTLNVWRVYDR